MIAMRVRAVDEMRGDATLFKVIPPLEGHEYVISSAIDNEYATETYVFPSNELGQVTDWLELSVSMRGVYDVDAPLESAGYRIQ